VAIHVDQIADAFADQATRKWRNVAYHPEARVSLILADNSVGLTAVVVANNGDAMAKRDDFDARRRRPQFRTRDTFGEISRVARSEFERATTLVHIFYSLCVLVPLHGDYDSLSEGLG
jgi:hypothetical protein